MSTLVKASFPAQTTGKENLTSDGTGHLVYLASPYSHFDPAVQEARFQAVCRCAAEMMRGGDHVFSPIAHTHPIAAHGLPGDWEFWQSYDRLMLSRCNELAVLCLPGWRESVGVRAEIDIAGRLGLPARFIPEPTQTLAEGEHHGTCC
jgi:hypothetical protein